MGRDPSTKKRVTFCISLQGISILVYFLRTLIVVSIYYIFGKYLFIGGLVVRRPCCAGDEGVPSAFPRALRGILTVLGSNNPKLD